MLFAVIRRTNARNHYFPESKNVHHRLRDWEEIAEGLKKFAQEECLAAASFKTIGAFSKVELAWFDWESKTYRPSVELSEQLELLSLIGDIALDKGSQPFTPMPLLAARMALHTADIFSRLLSVRLARLFSRKARGTSKRNSTRNPA
jgi:hypothetical protein